MAAALLVCAALATDAQDRAFHHSAQLAVSENFVVRSPSGHPGADEVSARCEALRAQLADQWLGSGQAPWRPRCEVTIHTGYSTYLAAVGRNGGQTRGSSLVLLEDDRIVARRVDVLADARGTVTALAHEVTHVVVADRFGARSPPTWANEGIATLSDSDAKQALHRRDCHRALLAGKNLRMMDLLTCERVSTEQRASFYGQSLSLVNFLVSKKDAATLLHFVDLSMDEGYDSALRATYGINGVRELETVWRDYVSRRDRASDQRVRTVDLRRPTRSTEQSKEQSNEQSKTHTVSGQAAQTGQTAVRTSAASTATLPGAASGGSRRPERSNKRSKTQTISE